MRTVKFPEKTSVANKKREAEKDKIRKKMIAAEKPKKPLRIDIPLGPTPEPQPMGGLMGGQMGQQQNPLNLI